MRSKKTYTPEVVAKALRDCNGAVTRAAERLGACHKTIERIVRENPELRPLVGGRRAYHGSPGRGGRRAALPSPPLTTERQRLVLDNVKLAYHHAAKSWRALQWNTGRDSKARLEELNQVAVAGLCRGAALFDPARGYTFCTYATWWVRNHLQLYCHAESNDGFYVPSADGRAIWGAGSAVHISEIDARGRRDGESFAGEIPERSSTDAASDYERRHDAGSLWGTAAETLTRTEYKVLRARFVDGKSFGDLSAEIGRTKERVRQIQNQALDKLRGCRVLRELAEA